jgi:multidrug transporter EmrE-like cation transporter
VTLAVLFAVYGIASVAGLVLLKGWLPRASEAVLDGRWLSVDLGFAVAGGALYVASFLCWLIIVVRAPLSWAFPLAFGITALGTTVAGATMFGEGLSAMRIAGILTILAGVTLLGLERA